jgi:DNA-directed RNA polymerase subunit RPC12/RpoP
MTALVCDRCGREIFPGEEVVIVGADELGTETRIIVDGPPVVHATCPLPEYERSIRRIGRPFWHYDEATDESVCPECGYRIGWDAITPAVRRRSDDPDDLTKGMLVLEWEHAEAEHPETLT